jgi:hypothetical protein
MKTRRIFFCLQIDSSGVCVAKFVSNSEVAAACAILGGTCPRLLAHFIGGARFSQSSVRVCWLGISILHRRGTPRSFVAAEWNLLEVFGAREALGSHVIEPMYGALHNLAADA